MKKELNLTASILLPLIAATGSSCAEKVQTPPNIVIIYADDLGYGDVSCYGADKIQTPNIDRLAASGLKFTRAHATSATCTPSRYSLLTGEYAWRRPNTNIATGDAIAIIKPGTETIASLLKKQGYTTGVIGKWHLGLGPEGGANWNGEIDHAPLDIGFDYCYLIPATGDRVPTVYVENRRVVGLDPADPITVSFKGPINDEPTGKTHPELLKMMYSQGHDMTIVNGISRIGYMAGGHTARWIDEDMADVITGKAVEFIRMHKTQPFFLYYATHDIHVPRVPHHRFAGKSGMGPRGDAILQFDWAVGEIIKEIENQGLKENTLVILSSDNGPVIDDGYQDQAVELLGGHTPSGPLRGGKYSAFEAGTRIPFITSWPGTIKPGTSDALFSQIDLLASLTNLSEKNESPEIHKDSHNHVALLLGKSKTNRPFVVEQSVNSTLSLIVNQWKYIEPSKGPEINRGTQTELGNRPYPQLYDVVSDIGEKTNLAEKFPEKLLEMQEMLLKVRENKPGMAE
jgi:arylsulfatase A-like enzyme